jgi:hypothetical protein
MADGGRTWRASIKLTVIDGKTGRERTINRGIKSPITGKRWGCTRNISPRAVEAHLAAKAEERASRQLVVGNNRKLPIQLDNSEAASAAREAA